MSSIRARFARLVPLALALGATMAVSACGGGSGSGGGGNLPSGTDLLKQSATAMSSVTSMSFTIGTDGDPGIPIKNANGKLLKSGDAQGTLQLKQQGQLAALNFTLAGNSVYLKGPTGGYRKLPRAMVVAFYDPSAILDPQRGVPLLLTKATGPKTEAKDSIGGQDAYRVKATLPKDAAASLVPGLAKDVTGEVWISTTEHRLLKVRADVPAASGGGTGTVTATFADFNSPFKITAPTQ